LEVGDTAGLETCATKACAGQSKILKATDFGYRKITIERPLRLNFQASGERIERLKRESGFMNLAVSKKKEAKAKAAEEAGADALSLVNTFLGMAVDLDARRPKMANVFGGLSGPAIKPLALRLVYQAARSVRIPVIGMGGIMTGRDALEFLLVGARAVEVGTANMVDPEASVRVIDEMTEYCRRNGLDRLSDIVGRLQA